MTEGEKDRYSEVAMRMGHAIVIFFRFAIAPSIIFGSYAVWTLSPNGIVAFCILFFGTSIPWFLCMTVFNILAIPAIMLYEKFQLEAPRRFLRIAYAWSMFLLARIIHGHEIYGEENIPLSSGGLLVYYHPVLTFDILFLNSKRYIERGTLLGGVAHRLLVFIFLSGFTKLMEFHADRNQLIRDLKDGRVCAVAPGGEVEGALSEDYAPVWGGRVGFAKVAMESGVPVIPMFTVNCREAMPLTNWGFTEFFKEVFRRKKVTMFFPVIAFPVKLRTYIGEPIRCGENESAADFAERVRAAMMDLRDRHQPRPGSIVLALLERFGYPSPTNELRRRKQG